MTPSLGTTTAPGEFLAPFVPSPEVLVDRMLEVARVGPGDTVYDLGAGDGRIVVAAAQRFGARAVGVELDNNRFAFASARIRDFGLEPRARMVHGDLLAIDLTPTTVVTLYQLPSVNEMLRPALERQLRPGARVVALDFPVDGWEASNVLTAQLTDGSQHAIYLYLIGETKKESANMPVAQGEKAFVGGICWLELEGAPAAFLKSAEGGDATADVKGGKVGPDLMVHKHIAGVKYEDIRVSFGPAVFNSLPGWIDTTMRRVDRPMNGAVVVADYKGKEMSRLNFFNGMISEIGFPALDAGSKDSAYVTLKIAPQSTTRAAGGGLQVPSLNATKKLWQSCNFCLEIDGLDCSRVQVVDQLTITRQLTPDMTGEQRDNSRETGYLEIPNLALTLSQVGSETFSKWHEDFVIKGNNGSEMTKNGTLTCFDSDLRTVLFTLTFRNLGIFKLTPEKYEEGDNAPTTLRAEMYCEEITFQGKSADLLTATVIEQPATDFGPPPSPSQALSPSLRGTPMVISPYAQPFAAGATVNWKQAAQPSVADPTIKFDKIAPVPYKEAPVPDEVAAPLRLGRPLRFRS